MKRKSALLARLVGGSPLKRTKQAHAPLQTLPDRRLAPTLPAGDDDDDDKCLMPSPSSTPLSLSSSSSSIGPVTPAAASPSREQCTQERPQIAEPLSPCAANGAAGRASAPAPLPVQQPKSVAAEVTLVRPPITPSASPLPDGARADAAERGFYAAWGLNARRPDQPLHRRNPGPNPVSVSLAALRDLNPDEYVVAEKTDGVRYALLLCGDETGNPMAVMIDRAGRKFEVAVRAAARFFDGTGTLLDGELAWERPLPQTGTSAAQTPRPMTVERLVAVGGASGGRSEEATRPLNCQESDATTAQSHSTTQQGQATATTTAMTGAMPDTLVYWVFDAVRVAGVSQRDADYETRIELVQRLIQGREADDLIEASPGDNPHDLAFRAKPCVPARMVDSVWSTDAPRLRHGSDGLILTPLRDPIRTGTHWRQFKWKHRHTLDLQLRGRRRDNGTWLWGLYYLEADWTVPTPDAIASAGTRPVGLPPPAPEAAALGQNLSTSGTGAEKGCSDVAMRARYLNACEGILYRRSDVARASRDRASAARSSARHGRQGTTTTMSSFDKGQNVPFKGHVTATTASAISATGPTTDGNAHKGTQQGATFGDRNNSNNRHDDTAGDEPECLVVFVLQKDAALDALVERVLRERPAARSIKCVVECEAAFVAPPAGWTPPPNAPEGGVRLLRCAIERLRTDKTDPNVRYTVRQTILNIDEAIAYATVRAALCRPRAPAL